MGDLTLTGYLVIAVAVVLAAALQASIGFGMGMLAAPVVALVDPGLIPGTLILLAVVVTLLVVLTERQHIDLGGTGWALAGRVPGTVAGALAGGRTPGAGAGADARRRRHSSAWCSPSVGWAPQPGAAPTWSWPAPPRA